MGHANDKRGSGKPAPFFRFFAGAWFADVARISLEAQGAYMRLLAWSWLNGPVPFDAKARSRILGVQGARAKRLWAEIEEFWIVGDLGLVNPRLEQERGNLVALPRSSPLDGPQTHDFLGSGDFPTNGRLSGAETDRKSGPHGSETRVDNPTPPQRAKKTGSSLSTSLQLPYDSSLSRSVQSSLSESESGALLASNSKGYERERALRSLARELGWEDEWRFEWIATVARRPTPSSWPDSLEDEWNLWLVHLCERTDFKSKRKTPGCIDAQIRKLERFARDTSYEYARDFLAECQAHNATGFQPFAVRDSLAAWKARRGGGRVSNSQRLADDLRGFYDAAH